jgi:hypothetical protein
MSKPDPSITANLLNSVLGKPEAHHESASKRPGKQSHTEAHGENPTPKPPKLKTAKNSASGQGRMRSSNRGK